MTTDNAMQTTTANPATPEPTAAPAQPAPTDNPAPAPADTQQPVDKKPDQGQLLFTDPEKTAENKAEKKEGEEGKDGKDDNAPAFVTADDIKVPDDMPIADESKAEINALLEKHKITGDEGKALIQDIMDLHIKSQQQAVEAWGETVAGWRKEVETDPQIGGAHLKENIKSANDVVRRFASDPNFGGSPELLEELQNDLILLGLGNKKSFMRFMLNISNATKNGSLAGTSTGGGGEKKPLANVMWPGMAQ